MKPKAPMYRISSPSSPQIKSFTARKPGKGAGVMARKVFPDGGFDIRLMDMTAPAGGAYTEYFFVCGGAKLTVRAELITE